MPVGDQDKRPGGTGDQRLPALAFQVLASLGGGAGVSVAESVPTTRVSLLELSHGTLQHTLHRPVGTPAWATGVQCAASPA